MLRNLLLTIGIVLTANLLVFSQSGTLKGTVKDAETGEPIPFANIVLELGGTQVGGTTSDFDGNYIIKPIPPGKYDLKATFVGYKTQIIQGIVIPSDQITFYDLELVSTAATLEEVEITSYKVPLISKDQTSSGANITSEEIEKMPNRSADGVAATVGGVFSRDGERGNVRGARSDGTVTYIDGIKVTTGSAALPPSAIEQVSVILGGLPAQYGDATGGVINVTTKGPSRSFGAGVELESSQFLDPYGYNRLGFNLNGPIFTKKNEQGEVLSSLLGYFLAGDITYREDGNPSAIGIYKARDGVIDFLEENPLRVSGQASGGTLENAEFLRLDDLEHVNTTQNTSRYSINLSGKLDIRTTETINLTFGGQYVQNERNNYSYRASLLNFDKNTLVRQNTWRVFGRFTQRFPADREKNSLFKNVFYSIQADYSQFTQQFYDPDHKEDIFKYGYLGKFDVYKTPTYELGSDTINGQAYNDVLLLNSWDFDTLVTFDPSSFNPVAARWTTSYYDLFQGNPVGNYQNFDQIQLGGGLLNGQQPSSVYQLYQSPGTIQSGFGETLNSQIGINVAFSADIGNHEMKLGFQYEQRSENFYNYSAVGMWPLMRGLTNFHIMELDKENPIPVYFDGEFQNRIIYKRKYDANSQRIFDQNLRAKLGLPVDGLDYIIPYSYDFEEQSIIYYDENGDRHKAFYDGDLFNVNMFSPDELLNNGNSYVGYRGFTYTGEKLDTKPSFDDFFNEQDENGMYTRPIGAYEPIYMAGYIQDKFAFRDLIFNIGVRFDRFDANQQVLQDPYVLYPTRSVSEVNDINGIPVDHPANLGGDYVVYVDNVKSPTTVLGYRNGNTWYNSQGIEINDPGILTSSAGIAPYLENPDQSEVNIESFEDYEPQWSIMPRISFSFPISDEALFFAHYDVLTQRPTSNITVSPATYLYFTEISGIVNNPNLKPQKTIDYELGFQQKLSNTSSMTITSFYREQRDMIQTFRYTGAYPKDYTSFTNIDFGTVKGLTVNYDLRRTKNARIRAAYTLQFADATGASPTTAAALIASGQPNLRSTFPVPWDRRHQINLLLDYRFQEETKSNILRNSGFSVTLNGGSGTPYTASRNITSPISGGTRLLKGTYGGSRLPWQFRLDLRVDKEFYFKFSDSQTRDSYLNVYLQVLNALDTKNVVNVYSFTGNADDDGYLSSAEWQKQIEGQVNPQSFRDLYSVFVNNPNNYSSPRMIRLGLIFNF